MADDREHTKKLIENFLSGFEHAQTRDPEDLMKDFADDGIWWASGSISASGDASKAEMIQRLRDVRQISEFGLKITPTSWIIEGDRAAVEAHSYMPLSNGKTYKNQYHFVITVKNGKVQHVKEYMDTKHVFDILESQ